MDEQAKSKTIDIDILRMKGINKERIYPTKEKEKVKEIIDVFFDDNRKTKLHADGTKLIKTFIKAKNSPVKLKNEKSPEQKNLVEKVIQCSYDLPDTSNVKQISQLPFIKSKYGRVEKKPQF